MFSQQHTRKKETNVSYCEIVFTFYILDCQSVLYYSTCKAYKSAFWNCFKRHAKLGYRTEPKYTLNVSKQQNQRSWLMVTDKMILLPYGMRDGLPRCLSFFWWYRILLFQILYICHDSAGTPSWFLCVFWWNKIQLPMLFNIKLFMFNWRKESHTWDGILT